MKRIKFISAILSAVILLSCGCSGDSEEMEAMREQINALQSRLDEKEAPQSDIASESHDVAPEAQDKAQDDAPSTETPDSEEDVLTPSTAPSDKEWESYLSPISVAPTGEHQYAIFWNGKLCHTLTGMYYNWCADPSNKTYIFETNKYVCCINNGHLEFQEEKFAPTLVSTPIAVSRSGDVVAYAVDDNTLKLYDCVTKKTTVISDDVPVNDIVLSYNGRSVLFSNAYRVRIDSFMKSDDLSVYRCVDGKVTYLCDGLPLAITDDGKYCFVERFSINDYENGYRDRGLFVIDNEGNETAVYSGFQYTSPQHLLFDKDSLRLRYILKNENYETGVCGYYDCVSGKNVMYTVDSAIEAPDRYAQIKPLKERRLGSRSVVFSTDEFDEKDYSAYSAQILYSDKDSGLKLLVDGAYHPKYCKKTGLLYFKDKSDGSLCFMNADGNVTVSGQKDVQSYGIFADGSSIYFADSNGNLFLADAEIKNARLVDSNIVYEGYMNGLTKIGDYTYIVGKNTVVYHKENDDKLYLYNGRLRYLTGYRPSSVSENACSSNNYYELSLYDTSKNSAVYPNIKYLVLYKDDDDGVYLLDENGNVLHDGVIVDRAVEVPSEGM